jgi:hypothetical protein
MRKSIVLLDPTDESSPAMRERLPRPKELSSLRIGLLDISKARGNIYLDEIEKQLTGRGLAVQRFQKPTFARVAPFELLQQISGRCDVVIEALAD